MSRGGSRPPLASTSLVRQLKQAAADPGFSPSSLLGDGSALLNKANRIQGFLKGQRQRSGNSNAKSEWLKTAQQLEEESLSIEREVLQALQVLQQHNAQADPELTSFASEATNEIPQTSHAARVLRLDLRAQVITVADMHKRIREHGAPPDEALKLLHGMKTLQADAAQHLDVLAHAAHHASQEAQICWPSCLASQAGPHSGHVRRESTPGTASDTQDASEPHWDSTDQQDAGRSGDDVGWAQQEASSAWARDNALLDEMIGRFALADDTAKARIRVVFSALRQRHQNQLDQWLNETMALGVSTLAADTGGWPDDEHSLFVSLRMKCWKDKTAVGGVRGQGISRDALMKQLAVAMPGRSLTELISHDDWLTAHKLQQRKRRGLLDSWARERAQFLEDSAALLDESHQLVAAKAMLAADRLAHELGRDRVRNDLNDLRVIALEEAALSAARRQEQAEEEAQRVLEAEALAAAEAAHKKELIAAYRAELQRKFELDNMASAMAQAEQEKQRSAQAVVNRSRVEWRHAEFLVKQDKAREAKEVEAAAAADREARLERLRALVKPDVEADPKRVFLPTESSSAVDEKAPGAFNDVYGYSVEEVFKDKRMRVMEALRQVGLHNTDYGRHAIANAPAASVTRMDNLTFDQRAALK